MNLKLISIIITVVLAMIVGGLIYTTVSDSNNSNNNNTDTDIDEIPEPDEPENNLIDGSNLPNGVTINDSSYEIDKSELISEHKSNINSNNIKLEYETDSNNKIVKKVDDRVYINKGSQEVYFDGIYKIFKNGDTYDANRAEVDINEYTAESDINLLLTELDLDSITMNENDDIIMEFKSQESNTLRYRYGYDSIRSASATLRYSTEDNIIDRININVYGESQGSVDSVEEDYSIKTDNVELTEPSWVSIAENSVSVVIGTLNTQENNIRLDHEGLSSIDTNSKIIVDNGRNTTEINISKPFKKGDSMFIYTTENGWKATINTVPDQGVRDIDTDVNIFAEDSSGNTYFDLRF